MTHTKGPWLIQGTTVYTLCNGENAWQAQVSQDGKHKTPVEEVQANANLIAAAPELLEALETLLEASRSSAGPEEKLNAQKLAKGVINKAKGNTQ